VTIGEEAKQWYEEHEPPGSFAAALLRCFLLGIVVKRPDFILLAEEVLSDGQEVIAFGPHISVNCWWVHYVAASRSEEITPLDFMDETPHPLGYVGFKRRGKTKIYAWDRLRKDIYGRCSQSSSSSSP
jgi:hypothetical protein